MVLWARWRRIRRRRKKAYVVADCARVAAGGERTRVADIYRAHGISEATFYIWRKKYSRLCLSERRELRQVRAENSKLKHLVADLSLDRDILQEIAQKKAVRPRHRRELRRWTQTVSALSTRRVSGLIMI